MKLRILYATKFNMEKACQALRAYAQWREASLPPHLTPPSLAFLESGAIYTLGRDNRFRPLVIVNAPLLAQKGQIEVALQALTILFEFVLEHIMLPGQIENWLRTNAHYFFLKGGHLGLGRAGDN